MECLLASQFQTLKVNSTSIHCRGASCLQRGEGRVASVG